MPRLSESVNFKKLKRLTLRYIIALFIVLALFFVIQLFLIYGKSMPEMLAPFESTSNISAHIEKQANIIVRLLVVWPVMVFSMMLGFMYHVRLIKKLLHSIEELEKK